jgi:hypothetical protein
VTDSPTPETGAEPTPDAAPGPATSEAAVAPAASEAAAPPKAKKTVQVPVWVLVGVVAAVFVVGAFFLGRTTAPESDSGPKTLSDAVEMTASGDMEVGDFNARRLLEALSRNDQLDLGLLGDLLSGGGRN